MDEYNHKKIYIGDLADITSSELEKVFSKFGVITHIKLIEGKEYGFITFERSSSAQEAISAMDGTLIRDHKIKVNRAKMMDRSRHGSGNSSWMDEDGSIRTEAPRYTFPTPQVPDHPPRTLTSYDDLL
ncbi:uncharacterized protein BX664DRAFT_320041 [Halteromyces radiatus]|uniref:uncharacterized protein n=1 Tax=Halteromyces radiatus TaxID=101107 RepID=UPI0022205634|nr:uncharacterized protein BX664DRAFT_320041 [Halteromyces radiatus]KAI8098965.1 hypothetical protein BX664DRAFT_320041 [Halteromyces radiatus]